jgi:hypothetical protein
MTYTSQVNKKSPVFMRFFRVLSGRMGVRGSRRARRMTSDRKISPDFTLLCGVIHNAARRTFRAAYVEVKKQKRCRSRNSDGCLWGAHECRFSQGHKGRHRCRFQMEGTMVKKFKNPVPCNKAW